MVDEQAEQARQHWRQAQNDVWLSILKETPLFEAGGGQGRPGGLAVSNTSVSLNYCF